MFWHAVPPSAALRPRRLKRRPNQTVQRMGAFQLPSETKCLLTPKGLMQFRRPYAIHAERREADQTVAKTGSPVALVEMVCSCCRGNRCREFSFTRDRVFPPDRRTFSSRASGRQ